MRSEGKACPAPLYDNNDAPDRIVDPPAPYGMEVPASPPRTRSTAALCSRGHVRAQLNHDIARRDRRMHAHIGSLASAGNW